MYTLPPGSRVGDAVARAGGMSKNADPVAINLAQRLVDEMQITVPEKGRQAVVTKPTVPPPTATPTPVPPTPTTAPEPVEPTATTTGSSTEPARTAEPQPAGRVNLNTATQAELETLPGIGPSKALAIIEYREQHGQFRSAEELQEVKGIGPKTWEALKDKVTV